MFKKSLLGAAVAVVIAVPDIASAEVETSAILKNETAVFLRNGLRTGEATSMLDYKGDGRKIGKFENTAKIFFNGDLGEESSWHGELNLVYDAAAQKHYKGHKNYSQNDWLRELYVDTSLGGWDVRAGKQQVVWGTADGIKLLDIINPTDFREMVQNTMEDSRIPVWMLNAEQNIGENGNLQFVVSQAAENQIPGLNSNGDSGHGYIMKGVDSISGRVYGFYNVTPALSNVAASFNMAAPGFGPGITSLVNPAVAGFTVDGFASNPDPLRRGINGTIILNTIAQQPTAFGLPGFNGNNNVTDLMAVTGGLPNQVNWNPNNPTSAFEYMSLASFGTFNTFTSLLNPAAPPSRTNPQTGIKTAWKKDAKYGPNIGGRFRGSLDNGLNYSLNYFYHYSANPEINLSWRDAVTGERLKVVRAPTGPTGAIVTGIPSLTRAQALTNWNVHTGAPGPIPTHILLQNAAGRYYGVFDPATGASNVNTNPAQLLFTETVHRVQSFGGSFDYSMDLQDVPLVLRGEFLYDKGEKQPVVDRFLLGIGDLSNALTMKSADYFKYVLGADVTVMTNLLASFQFIQFRNLSYIDQPATCTTQSGAFTAVNCGRYTADFSTLHLTNGLQKGWKNKEFYSFFLSKPFGESDLGRWNNIIMYEDGGGFWDRLDAEYSLSDELVISGEINMYWGDQNTMFGQFKNSSNVQVGLKYIIE